MAAKHFNNKIVVSRNIIEMYQYENPYYFDIKKDKNNRTKCIATEEKKAMNRTKAVNRAIKDVRRFIASNYTKNTTKFITLGFKENITMISEAKKKLAQFHRRLKRRLNAAPKYVGVYEYQSNGKIHFHIIYFNLNNINYEELLKIWNNGSAYIQTVRYGVTSFNHLTNYMLKANENREDEKNMYFRSLNLNEPKEIRNDLIAKKVNELLDNTESLYVYNNQNEFCGNFITKAFDLSNLDFKLKNEILKVLLS